MCIESNGTSMLLLGVLVVFNLLGGDMNDILCMLLMGTLPFWKSRISMRADVWLVVNEKERGTRVDTNVIYWRLKLDFGYV